MKKICLFLVMAGILHQSLIAQQQDSTHATPTDLAAMHLKKSKNQKNLAWVMLGTGAALITAAAISGSHEHSDWDATVTDGVLGITGGLIALGSIPVFMASDKNKRKAELYLHPTNTLLTPGQKIKLAPQLTLTVRL